MSAVSLFTHALAFLAGCGFVVGVALMLSAKGNADPRDTDERTGDAPKRQLRPL